MFDMRILATITYYTITRSIEHNQQHFSEDTHTLSLLTDRITTTEKLEFSIDNVFDLSFRAVSVDYGLMYLHTNQGLFSFQVKEEKPLVFLEEFKRLKK